MPVSVVNIDVAIRCEACIIAGPTTETRHMSIEFASTREQVDGHYVYRSIIPSHTSWLGKTPETRDERSDKRRFPAAFLYRLKNGVMAVTYGKSPKGRWASRVVASVVFTND